MPYVKDDDGRLNNFAREPKMYQADPMTAGQKRNYLLIGIGTAVLAGALIAVAAIVS